MSIQTRRLLAGLAAVGFAVGVYLGLATIKVAAVDGTLNCGSAFGPKSNPFAGRLVQAECDSRVNGRETLAVAIIVASGGVFLVATAGIKRQRETAPAEVTPPPRNVSP